MKNQKDTGRPLVGDDKMMDNRMKDKSFPINRDITCMQCGHDGVMDIHDENDEVADGRLFLHLGHNPFSGDLHYLCTACGIVLLVDPMLALGGKAIIGMPQLRTGKKTLGGEGLLHGSISGHLARLFLNENDERRLS